MMKIFAAVIILFLSIEGFTQTFWKIRTESGEEILLTIEVNSSAKTFKAYTRKEAIKEIAGFFTYNLAHAAGKLKYPEIVYIEGKADQQNDSLKLKGVFYYTDKKYDFQSTISGNKFAGKYTDNKNRLHQLTGEKLASNKPIRNYQAIVNSAISLAEKKLPRIDWIKSSEWQDFKESVNNLKSKITDDYELGAVIMWYAKKLSFSPFEIEKTSNRSTSGKTKITPRLVMVKPGIGLIDGNLAPSSPKEMDSIANLAIQSKITAMVIDLRGRSRLPVASVQLLLNYLSPKEFNAGIFLSKKWWEAHSAFPRLNDYKSLGNESMYASGELHFNKEMGYYLRAQPLKNRFGGKVFVIIDSRTNKASEVLAWILKREKIASLVGQKTAGITAISEKMPISDEFILEIPVAEFYEFEGKPISVSGIEPDISCNPQLSMEYIMKEF